jgi:hypothetical protein
MTHGTLKEQNQAGSHFTRKNLSITPSLLSFLLGRRRVRKEADPHDIFPVTENPIKKTFARSCNRQTDPMRPSYHIHSTLYCDDDKSKPKRLPQYIPDNHLLRTDDIDGAQAGYLVEHQLSLPNSMRKEFRNTNFIYDIEGTSADSKKHTIVTTRCSNPLQPVYRSLDGDTLIGGPIDSLVPANLIDRNTESYKSFGKITKGNQWNSSMQSKESMSHLSKPPPVPTRQPSARDFYSTTQASGLNFDSTSTTSQYFDFGASSNSREGRRPSDETSKSYAEKIHQDAQVLVVHSVPSHEQNQLRSVVMAERSSNSLAVPRRSLSAVPRLSRDQIMDASANPSLSARNKSQTSSRQSTARKSSRSDSLSSKRQSAELTAEISAIRGL